jgi:hypothetical protein
LLYLFEREESARNCHQVIAQWATGEANVNKPDVYSLTPLSQAIEQGHEKMAGLLHVRGEVDVSLKNKDCHKPLPRPAHLGREKTIQAVDAVDGIRVPRRLVIRAAISDPSILT